MDSIDIRVPSDYAKKVLTSELNSYAYNYENQVLVYLREFSYGDNGEMQTNVEMYPMQKEIPMSEKFTVENPAIPGMKIIDTDKLCIKEMNDLMVQLMQYCANTSCIKTNAPVFARNIPEDQMEEDSDWQDPPIPYGPGIKPEPGDIVIPIPEEPLNFENPYKFDKENMNEDK